uniref:Uncharacterized protein n=1 Tax=Parascaris equorum TaxID=6256 RepID=A0A914RQ06_PAREQ
MLVKSNLVINWIQWVCMELHPFSHRSIFRKEDKFSSMRQQVSLTH